jgi:hypothetical protein
MSKERWVVSELEKRYGVDITRRWLANLANLGGIPVSDIDRLADLLDTLLTDPQDGDILQYEAASQRWKNKVVGGGNNPVLHATHIVTAADFAAFAADPTQFNGGYGFTVIEAPLDANTFIYPTNVMIMLIKGPTGTPYTLPAGAQELLNGLIIATVGMNNDSRSWFGTTGGIFTEQGVSIVRSMEIDTTLPNIEKAWVINQPLLLMENFFPFAIGGDGAIRVDIEYQLKSFPS